MDKYDKLSELNTHIKSLFRELLTLEVEKNCHQEEILDRVLYLLELYISNEVELRIKKELHLIVKTVLQEVKEDNNG
jgi:hypothetical protein